MSSYTLFLALGASVGFWLTFREIDRKGLPLRATGITAILAFTAGVFGARLLNWLLHQRLYADSASPLTVVWERGGMWMYGGLAMAGAVGYAGCRLAKLDAWDVADTLVVAWVPFLSFMRLGCFLNGCCYGRPTAGPLGLVAGGAPNEVRFGVPSYPTQLIAVVATLGLFALLWWMRTRRRFIGQLTVVFLVLYPAFRFLHDFLRGDPTIVWRVADFGSVGLNQLISLPFAAIGVAAGLCLTRRGRPRSDPPPSPPDGARDHR